MKGLKKIGRTTLFLIITFTVSYSSVAIFYLLGGKYQTTAGTILAVCYMFIPMLAAIITDRVIHGDKVIEPFFISFKFNRWFLAAWLLPLLLSFLTLAISLLFADVKYSPDMQGFINRLGDSLTPEKLEEMERQREMIPIHPVWLLVISGLVAGVTINAVAGFGEEAGWRGFLLKEFRNMLFLKASLIIGFIWGIWHAPVILLGHNYPRHPGLGVIMMIIWCILLTPMFIYITIKARSVIAAAVLHGTLNATGGISLMVISGGNDLTVGITGLAGFIALAIILAGLLFYDVLISKEKVWQKKIYQSI